MKKSWFLFLLLFSFSLFAQSEREKELLLEKELLEEEFITHRNNVEKYKIGLESEQEKLKENEERLHYLENYEKNFSQNKAQALAILRERRGRFYRCLRESLEDKNKLDYAYCSKRYRPRIKDEDIERVMEWRKTLEIPLVEIQREKEKLPRLIDKNKDVIKGQENWYNFSVQKVDETQNLLKMNDLKFSEEKKLASELSQFTACGPNTPSINLEEETPYPGAKFKGPFVGVPRDNQDGLGTCYANAAKNLLVGISEGKDVASFLDLALAYKNSTGNLDAEGLDGGTSCTTLNAVKKKGYCPQNFSPLETGERNETGENLFKLGKYEYLGTNINLIRDFIQGLEKFEKNSSPIKEEVLKNALKMVNELKENKDIILPAPVVRVPVVEDWKLREAHGIKKLHKTISAEDFINEHNETYSKFYPEYVKGVLDGKSMDEIFEAYLIKLNPFINKYGLTSSIDEFKRVFKIRAGKDFNDPQVKAKLRASIDFLKKTLNKEEMSDEAFFDYCSSGGADTLSFLGTIQGLIDKIREDKVNVDKLFDEKGRFRSANELMQLTVAPSCLNPENRKELPPFYCDSGYGTISKIKSSGKTFNEQVRMMRERVVMSLVQGYPLGNSYPTSRTSGHINTIVGMRFNSQSQSCEYLIRESQTGRSDWQSETSIFNKIQALTEVRRFK